MFQVLETCQERKKRNKKKKHHEDLTLRLQQGNSDVMTGAEESGQAGSARVLPLGKHMLR